MADPTMKQCRTCEGQFAASRNDYTVNCPDCRKGEKKVKVTRSVNEDEYYQMGYKDGKKNGHKPGFSGYRSAAFNWSVSSGKLLPYERGFKDGRNAA